MSVDLQRHVQRDGIAAVATTVSVSVVIPTRNRGTLISETLEKLIAVAPAAAEILVVDQSTNGITAASVTDFSGKDPRVRLISTPTVGSSSARNVGWKAAAGDVVAYVDDDCVVEAGWFEAIVDEFKQPRVAAVFGRLTPYRQNTRNGTEVGMKASGQRAEYTSPLPPWWVGHGGNMAFRRTDLERVGGFDPLLSAGGRLCAGEDTDLAHRLLVKGGKIVYSPNAVAYHKHWKDWRSQKRMERAYGIGAGAQFAKYIRSGDSWGFRLFAVWMWQLGVRRMGAGFIKWRNPRVVYLGYCQLVYPWLGVLKSIKYRVDGSAMVYFDA